MYSPETVKELLISNGYNFKEISSSRFAILTNENRIDILKRVNGAIKGSVYDPTPSSVSSVGFVNVDNVKIFAKPASKQGAQSAGISNEQIVVDIIKNYTKNGPINVKFFETTSKQFSVVACTGADRVGADTSGRKKADIILYKNSTQIPISIKKDNAEYWESADNYFSSQAEKIITDGINQKKVKLIDNQTYFSIEPNIAVEAKYNEVTDIVFGSDILNQRGCIITKTFSTNDFVLTDNELVINVSNVIINQNDIPNDKKVYFLIRNDKTRKSIKKYPGIRVLAAYKSRINPNVLVLQR